MLQTVFRIPHEVAGLPIFGLGWALGAVGLVALGVLLTAVIRPAARQEAIGSLPMLAVMAAVALWVMPFLEERGPDETPLGLPIRGYGVMLVAAVVSGFALTLYRARHMGYDSDRVMSLLIGMFVCGILGARVFHVIQYWETLRVAGSWKETLANVVRFTEGGLVVYGSLIGGLLWTVYFTYRERWSLFRVGDLIAPGMFLGLALGRIGCLLNGCCHGGACENELLALRFPQASHPYMSQLKSGELLGAQFVAGDEGLMVERVDEDGLAQQQGVEVGSRVLVLPRDRDLQFARMSADQRAMVVIETKGSNARWNWEQLPSRSLPTRPAQIYSAVNAALLCLLLIAWHPYRRHDGELMMLLLTLYPLTRFLLELVRTDEAGRFGTSLTISQWVSFVFIAIAAAGWVAIRRRRTSSASPTIC
ncbi:MAG: prolipoprotein diacylglyceryl transferase [Planctomycetales bacterium]|nr:prolipoprotein diacylglyceryl transferase [Planctomycetales bacterium]